MNNLETLIFLGIIVFLVYFFDRKNFKKEAPLMYVRRFKKGLKFIEKYGSKHSKFFKLFGDLGIVFTFGITGLWYLLTEKKEKKYSQKYNLMLIFLTLFSFVFLMGIVPNPFIAIILTLLGASGMVFFLLLYSCKLILTRHITEAAVQLLLPVNIPNAPIFYLPLEYFISAIFAIVIVHEFAHAFVSVAHNIKVKSIGYGFLAILPLGFAEPDEKKLQKAPSVVKSRVYAAGSFSNIILTIILMLITFLIYTPSGFNYNGLVENMPSSILPEKGTITQVNNITIKTEYDFFAAMENYAPNQTIKLTINNQNYPLKLSSNPQNNSLPFIGIMKEKYTATHKSIRPEIELVLSKLGIIGTGIINFFNYLYMHLFWILNLSFAIAIVNILPIKYGLPLDGGFMFEELLKKLTTKNKAAKYTYFASMITLGIILFNIIGPYFVSLFF